MVFQPELPINREVVPKQQQLYQEIASSNVNVYKPPHINEQSTKINNLENHPLQSTQFGQQINLQPSFCQKIAQFFCGSCCNSSPAPENCALCKTSLKVGFKTTKSIRSSFKEYVSSIRQQKRQNLPRQYYFVPKYASNFK